MRVYVGASVSSLCAVDRCECCECICCRHVCDANYVLLTYLCSITEQTDVQVRMRVRMRDRKSVNLGAVWQAANLIVVRQGCEIECYVQGCKFECCVTGLRVLCGSNCVIVHACKCSCGSCREVWKVAASRKGWCRETPRSGHAGSTMHVCRDVCR